jgi:hypothetical protein
VRANVVAYVALFVALSGTAYAGVKPLLDKKGSVDSANVKNGSLAKGDLSGSSSDSSASRPMGPPTTPTRGRAPTRSLASR